ncbi:MAG: phosphopentomutase, partial [Spirochaetes bacterium]
CIRKTFEIARKKPAGDQFVFVNLVDTDMIYGHRRNPQGYHDAVAAIDAVLPELESLLDDGDVLAVTGDHGCDPTFKGTDHTREHVPLIFKTTGSDLLTADEASFGVRMSFSDLSVSIQKVFGKTPRGNGAAFL